MSYSEKQFDRWTPREETSWAFRVFKKHNHEFYRMYTAFDNSYKYTYKNLKEKGAKWEDRLSNHFIFTHPWEYDRFSDLKDWSNAFNDLENWVNLNALVAITSNFETYLATIIPLALESDVGLLFGTCRRIDGIEIIKHGHSNPFNFEDQVISCTKGTWEGRKNSYEKIFGQIPAIFSSNLSTLDKMRILRNNVAHAFGRDIEISRKKGEVTIVPSQKLKRESLLQYQNIIWKIVKAVDEHLSYSHIGEYQALLFYHKIYPTLNHSCHPHNRAMDLKKQIGRFGTTSAGKEYCKGLVNYYESL